MVGSFGFHNSIVSYTLQWQVFDTIESLSENAESEKEDKELQNKGL
jgi:hypothetical protein